MRKIQRYGWRPSIPDTRDIKVSFGAAPTVTSVDLRSGMPPVYDQGQLGSCTCNSTAACVDFARHKQGLDFMNPARLWLYWQVRKLEGTLGQDAGAEIRDVLKVLVSMGTPKESDYPYDISKYNDTPPDALVVEAAQFKTLKYRSPYTDIPNLKAGLALGFPFVFGFTVYDAFESDTVGKTGIVPMPTASESVQGGHAVAACGFDDTISDPSWPSTGAFLVRNSWGANWGISGHFWLPYSYFTPDLTSDFWSIRFEEATVA